MILEPRARIATLGSFDEEADSNTLVLGRIILAPSKKPTAYTHAQEA
jgi:hypothetical protein